LRKSVLLIACAALLSAPAARAAPDVSADVRCLLAMSVVASNKDKQIPGMLGIYFFAGRILRVHPTFDFPSGLKAETSKVTPQTLAAELKRCGPMVETVARGLQATQQSMKAAAPAAGQPPKSAPPPKAKP